MIWIVYNLQSAFCSCQSLLKSVVLEQAELSLADLCRILVAVAGNSLVKRLYLWAALDPCQVPFRGPLESECFSYS